MGNEKKYYMGTPGPELINLAFFIDDELVNEIDEIRRDYENGKFSTVTFTPQGDALPPELVEAILKAQESNDA